MLRLHAGHQPIRGVFFAFRTSPNIFSPTEGFFLPKGLSHSSSYEGCHCEAAPPLKGGNMRNSHQVDGGWLDEMGGEDLEGSGFKNEMPDQCTPTATRRQRSILAAGRSA